MNRMIITIKSENFDDTVLTYEKQSDIFVCVNSENDMADLFQKILKDMVNGQYQYQRINDEHIEEYKSLKEKGCAVLSVPSDWSVSKKYKNLSPADAILLYQMMWGVGYDFFIDGTKIESDETIQELEKRLQDFEIQSED